MAMGNLWKLFTDATRGDAQQIATVRDRTETKYTVEMSSGNYTDVQGQGSYETGSKVFIKGSQIIGQAPNLDYTEIEV
ncbi:hypothetical protein [Psychrobacter pygoscelis]|uniref:hypothetical protein n=1 Tax=Psychrobacter pygoscelis TaxID=2488563 RepID=UPI00103871F0|nr:hypothetical protein [Psychrobacter pygoscelis]